MKKSTMKAHELAMQVLEFVGPDCGFIDPPNDWSNGRAAWNEILIHEAKAFVKAHKGLDWGQSELDWHEESATWMQNALRVNDWSYE